MAGFEHYIIKHSKKLFPDIIKVKKPKRKNYKKHSVNYRTMSFGFPMNISNSYYSKKFKKKKKGKKKVSVSQ